MGAGGEGGPAFRMMWEGVVALALRVIFQETEIFSKFLVLRPENPAVCAYPFKRNPQK
jgi:hypothetical protein